MNHIYIVWEVVGNADDCSEDYTLKVPNGTKCYFCKLDTVYKFIYHMTIGPETISHLATQ